MLNTFKFSLNSLKDETYVPRIFALTIKKFDLKISVCYLSSNAKLQVLTTSRVAIDELLTSKATDFSYILPQHAVLGNGTIKMRKVFSICSCFAQRP